MKKGKRVLQVLITGVCVIALCVCAIGNTNKVVEIEDEPIALEDSIETLITEKEEDVRVIPDKYNCGAKGELKIAKLGQAFDTMYFKSSGGKNVIDFAYNNTKVSGTIVFENVDFSKYPISVVNEARVNRDICLVFKNCSFGSFSTGVSVSNISYEFNNCTLKNFYGSNATFKSCLFGGSFCDALNPFQEVNVLDSYFYDMASDDPAGKGIHTDGTQMYGHKDAKVKDVLFSNCRFEIPAINKDSAPASVNACVMIQLEYNDAENVQIKDCKLNGGGYTIYAHTTSDTINLKNICFDNVEVGVAHLYNDIYPHVSDGVTFNNVVETNSLYVGSVWTENESTNISVTNDTDKERTLLVYADGKEYTFVIPACPGGKNLHNSFSEFPFDLCISIPRKCDYVVCFDITDGEYKQVRFVNWSEANVYYSRKLANDKHEVNIAEDANKIEIEIDEGKSRDELQGTGLIKEGKCGNNVYYTIDNRGVLHLFGTGGTYNYHSLNCAPWYEERDVITWIEIEEGIQVLGNQLFRNLQNVKVIKLPETLMELRNNVFIGCSKLNDVYLPRSLKAIGNYCFCGTNIMKCEYGGTRSQLEALKVGSHNGRLMNYLY